MVVVVVVVVVVNAKRRQGKEHISTTMVMNIGHKRRHHKAPPTHTDAFDYSGIIQAIRIVEERGPEVGYY